MKNELNVWVMPTRQLSNSAAKPELRMPYLKIQTNQDISTEAAESLLKAASKAVAEGLGKPERYVMVNLDPSHPMLFAGDNTPTAYLELKSIGLPGDKTKALSASLCSLISTHADIEPARIYIEFADAPRHMWGWNNSTF